MDIEKVNRVLSYLNGTSVVPESDFDCLMAFNYVLLKKDKKLIDDFLNYFHTFSDDDLFFTINTCLLNEQKDIALDVLNKINSENIKNQNKKSNISYDELLNKIAIDLYNNNYLFLLDNYNIFKNSRNLIISKSAFELSKNNLNNFINSKIDDDFKCFLFISDYINEFISVNKKNKVFKKTFSSKENIDYFLNIMCNQFDIPNFKKDQINNLILASVYNENKYLYEYINSGGYLLKENLVANFCVINNIKNNLSKDIIKKFNFNDFIRNKNISDVFKLDYFFSNIGGYGSSDLSVDVFENLEKHIEMDALINHVGFEKTFNYVKDCNKFLGDNLVNILNNMIDLSEEKSNAFKYKSVVSEIVKKNTENKIKEKLNNYIIKYEKKYGANLSMVSELEQKFGNQLWINISFINPDYYPVFIKYIEKYGLNKKRNEDSVAILFDNDENNISPIEKKRAYEYLKNANKAYSRYRVKF